MQSTQTVDAHSSASLGAPVLSSQNVSLNLNGHRILHEVDLTLHAGEILALVGPNGAGKSTLLSALAGDLKPSSGRIQLGGADVTSFSALESARARAVQLQDGRVSFAFTAEEVVAMGRAPWHGTAYQRTDEAVIAHSQQITESTHLAGQRFPTLSGGEAARVSFARALAQETAILLLDEPTAAMDLRFQELVLSEVTQRAAAGVAVVTVLHDLSLASAYADTVVLMKDGAVRACGAPRDVLTADLIEEVYEHPVTVLEHPESGGLAILPKRTFSHTKKAGLKEYHS